MAKSRVLTVIQFAFILIATLLDGRGAVAVDGPSFDCSQGVRQTLAVILCTNPEAARADWDVNRAYWALYTDEQDEKAFSASVTGRCALPTLETQQQRAGRVFVQEVGRSLGAGLPVPRPKEVTEHHVQCVISAFRAHAATLRRSLTGELS